MPNAIESLEEEGRKSLKQSSRIIIISLAECQFIALDSFEPFPLLTDKSEKLMADTEILRINTLNNSLHRQIIFCPSDIRGALNIDWIKEKLNKRSAGIGDTQVNVCGYIWVKRRANNARARENGEEEKDVGKGFEWHSERAG